MKTKNCKYYMCLCASASLFCLGLSSPIVNAQLNEKSACRAILKDEERLACFDQLFAQQGSVEVVEDKEDKEDEQGPVQLITTSTMPLTTQSVMSSDNSQSELDDIDKRAQALINKSKTPESASLTNTAKVIPTAVINAKDPDDSFGSDSKVMLKKSENNDNDKLQSQVNSISKSLRGALNLTLANGQVWRQTDQTRSMVKEGDEVVIKKGILGAYYLSQSDSNRRIRVTRIQ